MDRRKLIRIAAGSVLGGGVGILALKKALKPDYLPAQEPTKLLYEGTTSFWAYSSLDASASAQIAYDHYQQGSCMYAVFASVISQLAEKYGEPYMSFPIHMMKYGHGGVGGFGTICGSLNGASALIGLFVPEKSAQDLLISGLLRWYEGARLPEFKPKKAIFDFNPPSSSSNSTLCHASITSWVKESGYKQNSNERKERCRRLTSDVAANVTTLLNNYTGNSYVTGGHECETVRKCMTCHGDQGKLANTSGGMSCTSCHTESIGHKAFSDIHYKVMKPR